MLLYFRAMIFAAVFTTALPTSSFSQDPIYSQYYFTPMQINPAFSGTTNSPLIGASFRLQWPGFSSAYRTYSLAYSQYFERINSGFGGLILSDNAGDGIMTNTRVSGYYSYRLRLSSDTYFQSGIEVTGIQSHLDWDKLVFGDQLDPVHGRVNPGGQPIPSEETRPENLTNRYFDLGFGLLFSSPDFYVGIGLRHLNSPNVGFLDEPGADNPRLSVLYTLMAGTEIALDHNENNYFVPNILFARQGKASQINAGFNLRFSSIHTGLYYRHSGRNPDAVQIHLGFEEQIYRIGYAYDLTISQLAGVGRGSHEISILINLDNQPGRQRVDYSDCLDIFR